MVQSRTAADIILHNGKVLTVDPGDSVQQALAVVGDRIGPVGSNDAIRALAGPETTSIDLRGRTVIPGIIDIHAHMDREGLKRIYPSLAGARSVEDILTVIREQVGLARPGEWITTMPVGDPPNYADVPENLAEGRYPTRWELDRAAPQNPVYIRGTWTPWNVPPSVGVANSLALELAGIDRHTQPPDSSVVIDKDGNGEPTGILIDRGRFPTLEFTLMKVAPRFSHAQRVKALKESMGLYNAVGTTGTYEGHGVAPEVLNAYKELWDRGEMTVRARLVLSPAFKSMAEAEREMERWSHSASGGGFGDEMLKISGYYFNYRGSRYIAQARSAGLPYTGWAGFSQAYNPPGRFLRLVRLAAHYNLRVNTIVRDQLDEVLRVFEEVHREIPINDRRWTLGHTRDATDGELERIRDLGLVIETIPLTELWLRGRPLVDSPELARRAAAHKTYLEENIPFGFGTDNKPYNPFVTLWSAVTRQERNTGQVLGPEQCLSRLEALRAFTLGGAYFSFDENRRGSLEPGKLADLAVLSGDLLEIAEDDIPELHSVLTMVGGKIVHRGEGL
ncbi:MAG: amidohydrolase [Chloroflexi bacterium]|nr:amidohydrolase [Chloroflexota bacterium]